MRSLVPKGANPRFLNVRISVPKGAKPVPKGAKLAPAVEFQDVTRGMVLDHVRRGS